MCEKERCGYWLTDSIKTHPVSVGQTSNMYVSHCSAGSGNPNNDAILYSDMICMNGMLAIYIDIVFMHFYNVKSVYHNVFL